jgi:hypothetical protein
MGWTRFNEAANFLKHADSDPDITKNVHEHHTEMGIGFATILYGRLTRQYTPEMNAFDLWIKAENPDAFKLPPDPDPDIEQGYRDAVEFLKSAPKSVRLLLAKALLEFFRAHKVEV